MNAETMSIALDVNLAVSLVSLVTLATAFVIGLALLPRPSKATVIWSAAFIVGTLGTYCLVAAGQFESRALRALSSGLMMTFIPIVWLGLRAHLGKRMPWFSVIGYSLIMVVALPLLAGLPEFTLGFRLAFLGSGIFAGFLAYDLIRMRAVQRDILLPLTFAACAYVLITVLAAMDAITQFAAPRADPLAVVREINGVGSLVVSQCAALTIVLLVRTQRRRNRGGAGAVVNQLTERLARAEALKESAWSLIDIRLDNREDLRIAAKSQGYAHILDTFHERVRAGLPASADVQRIDEARVVALIPGTEQAVRHHLRILLTKISAPDEGRDAAAISRVSASIGWASVAEAGYEYQALLAAASLGAADAQVLGGGRWGRARELATTLEG